MLFRSLSAVTLRGINYCQITEAAAGIGASGVADAIDASLRRMNPDLVLGDARIRPTVRSRFAASMGLPERRFDTLGYLAHLADEGLYRMRTNGLGFVWLTVRDHLTQQGILEQVGLLRAAYTKESGAMVSDPTYLRMSEAIHACA